LNCPTANTVTINGGTVSGGLHGIVPTNFQSIYLDAAPSAYAINGVVITGAAQNGVLVEDSPSNTNGSTVTAMVTGNCSIMAASRRVRDGADARATVINNRLRS